MLALCGFALGAGRARAADPDALWKIVHDRCVPNQIQYGDPAPCAKVDLNGGFALLKDQVGVAQFLLIPTTKLTGIEDPALLRPIIPDYWRDAWDARQSMATVLGKPVPDDDIGLAVNSKYGRSQNQLHIHIDCVRADVKQALADAAPRITAAWSSFTVPLAGHSYRVRRLGIGDNPFTVIGASAADMASETLALVGTGDPGLYLLEDHAQPALGDRGSAEQILDHDCAVLGE